MNTRAHVLLAALLIHCGDGAPSNSDPTDGSLTWPAHHAEIAIPDGGLGLVTNSGADEISVLDLAAGTVSGTVRVGIDPVGNDGPTRIVIDAVARRVFVALSYPPPTGDVGAHHAPGSDAVPGWIQILSLDDLHEIARREVDESPTDIALTPDRSRLVVTHFNLRQVVSAISTGHPVVEARSNLWVLDARDLRRLASVPLCAMAHGVAISADGARAYVACTAEDSMTIFDLTTYTIQARVAVGPSAAVSPANRYGPYTIAISQDQQLAVVGDREGHDVRVFDMQTQTFDHAVDVGGAVQFGVEAEDHQSFVFPIQSPDGLVRVRRNGWQIERSVAFDPNDCLYPTTAALGPDARLYLVCGAAGRSGSRTVASQVDVLDGDTLAIKSRFSVGVAPDSIAFAVRAP